MAERPIVAIPKKTEIEQELDSWIDDMPKSICFRDTLKIYAPICQHRCIPEALELSEKITDLFGQTAFYAHVSSCWKRTAPGGSTVVECEPVYVFEVEQRCVSKGMLRGLADAITDYGKKKHHRAISIKDGTIFIAGTQSTLKEFEDIAKKVPA